jgi:hypothetical protein
MEQKLYAKQVLKTVFAGGGGDLYKLNQRAKEATRGYGDNQGGCRVLGAGVGGIVVSDIL